MASETVLSNRDLVRHMLSLSRHATPLLAASKGLRLRQAPCAKLFERWAREGCPVEPGSEDEVNCLESIGGHSAAFCGAYEMIVYPGDIDQPSTASEASPQKVANDVLRRFLTKPPIGTSTRLWIRCERTILIFERHSSLTNTLSVTRDGWRKRGKPCRPTDKEVTRFLTDALTRTVSLATPCPEDSAAFGNVQMMPRSLSVRLSRWDERQREHLVLTAERL